MPAPAHRCSPSPDVLCRVLDGEAVLLDLASGRYFGLNEVGTRTWELIAEGKNFGEIRETLLAEFDVTPDVLDRDLDALVEELTRRGLVRSP